MLDLVNFEFNPLIMVPMLNLQDNYGGYMVAFAGHKYAARSTAAFVANSTYTVTSFTLVSKQAHCNWIWNLNSIMSFAV